mgnify:CR=1 FL=1
MKFGKLYFDWETTFEDFIQFWSACYNYKNAHLYSERIEKQKNLQSRILKNYLNGKMEDH